MYGKSKSDSVTESVTRSPIELFWTAKKEKDKKRESQIPKHTEK